MKARLPEFFTRHYQFGHQISLNYNRQGAHHKTLLGGIATVTLYAIMTCYFIVKLRMMLMKEQNLLSISEGIMSVEDALIPRELKDMMIEPTFFLRHNKSGLT